MSRIPQAALVALTLAWLAQAQSSFEDEPLPETVQELFLGDAVFVQEQWELQPVARLGVEADEMSFALAVELGLTDRVQVEVEAEGEARFEPTTAYGPTALSASVLASPYSRRATGRALSIGAEVSTPSLTSGLGDEEYSAGPVVILYQALGPVHVNASFGLEAEIQREPAFTGAPVVSLLVPSGPIVLVLELGASLGEERSWSASAGMLWHPTPEFEVGAGALATKYEDHLGIAAQLFVALEFDLTGEDDD